MFWKRQSNEEKLGKEALAAFLRWMKKMRPIAVTPTIEVTTWSSPSGAPLLPAGTRAVYSFHWGPKVLKVGQAGPGVGARYSYQHYRCDPQSSTLANAIVKSGGMNGIPLLSPDKVGDWIRQNTSRVDFIMPGSTANETVDALERFLFFYWDPMFEGRGSKTVENS